MEAPCSSTTLWVADQLGCLCFPPLGYDYSIKAADKFQGISTLFMTHPLGVLKKEQN